ncbi:peptidylprolyl isomerase [Actinomadura meyerae]|uniref:peptidylprolyl isomerase n=1 Tax=Actinomadura meyerae TaxID=240840 RepID=A0A239MKI0_9ACTN|nr:FKBP-type peptidyl-prolyl cis-trans isomerase [Actinomadura meyerae]SNT43155.1 peptidylprolyl isomerase [Actinomadura meyerae]
MSEDDKPRGKPAVKAKAKIPNAQSIRSPEFTPHGISAGRGSGLNRPSAPSALTAKQARKRRIMMIAGIVVAALAITGGVYWWVNRPDPVIEVTGKFAAEPKVEIPTKLAPVSSVKITNPIKGSGRAVADGDTVYVQFATYKWSKDKDEENSRVKSTSEKVSSTYEQQAQQPSGPRPLVIGKSGLKEIDKNLVGQTVGSRVVLQLPPSKDLSQLSPQQITDKDAVVFVMDIQAAVPKDPKPEGTAKKLDDKNLPKVADQGAKEPKITIPDADAPGKLQVKTLVEGTGPALAKGDDAVVNYVGKIWKSGDKFDSSWDNKQPANFPIGTGATIPGFDKGLTGAKVGSRVLLVLPPAEGYGKQGSPPKIKGDDTLVFVVDILAKIQK